MQEDLKVNQAQYLFVENCDISGAWHTCVDYFAVQYGHVLDSKIHIAGQWGMYVKGGTAYLRVENNEFYETWLGFSAGQAANLAVMVKPWLHYEAYDVKFVNNVLHDIPGTGVSAAGGYDTLLAYNTFYRVATDTNNGYGLAHFVRGERNCTPTDDLPDPVPTCGADTALGGWGPNFQTESVAVIPNRNVRVENNVWYNPMPEHSLYYQLGVDGPLTVPAGFPNVPSPSLTDDRLHIMGNVIWNGPEIGLPLVGSTYGGDTGCPSTNPDCNESQLALNNIINSLEPQLANPGGGDFRPSSGSNLYAVNTFTMPPFDWSDAPSSPAVPQGTLDNTVPGDRAGEPRTTTTAPGAYAAVPSSCAVLAAPYTLPGSGAAPLAVLFFANAAVASACAGGATYAWTFGDGGSSTEVNPRHVYTAAGTYPWTLTATAGGTSASGSGQVTVSADDCTLDCSASAPSGGSAGASLSFSASAYPSGSCSGSVAYDWDFGDGSTHSFLQNPAHAYASEGTYTWTLTASVGSAQCTRTGTIAISSASPPVITLMKKVSPPFKIVVLGSNLQNGIRVYIDGVQWTSVVWKKTTKMQLTGAIKAAVPKGSVKTFRFVNADGGEATQTWGW
jgi:PKD repeat protein